MRSGAFIRYGSVVPPLDSIFDREKQPRVDGPSGPPECRTRRGSFATIRRLGEGAWTRTRPRSRAVSRRAGLVFGRRAWAASPRRASTHPVAMSPKTAGSGASISKVSRIGTSGRKTTTNTATIAPAIPTQKLEAIAIETES